MSAEINAWQGKHVVILGAARQGIALARFLTGRGAQVTLSDLRPLDQLQEAVKALEGLPIRWAPGGHPLALLDQADVICPSGGVPLEIPLLVEARRRGIPLSNDSQIFLENAHGVVIGVTGSAGKTTTTTLIGRMVEAAQASRRDENGRPHAWVGGNIGNPLLAIVEQMQWGDLAVMELSSFQLEIMTCSPDVAVVLNITPNHLDRHGTMEAYTAAKAHILQHQSTDDCAVLGRDDPGAWSLAGLARGRLLSFGLAAPPGGQDGAYLDGERLMMQENGQATLLLTTADIRLRGAHNLLNVLAACTAALAAGLPVEALSTGVRGFGGVAHRLEFVRSWGGADWYNDSIATAPERAIAAIRAFDEPVVLLAGGRDKKLPWEAFAGLVRQRVDHLVVFGEAAGLVAAAVGGPGGRLRSVTRCAGLREAVQAAAALVEPGQVVLLAPGGTSFDEFTDFEERGEAFRKWVNELS
jgi:UDP-N-acetylmuramoylalanine--D-glutamate ligase